MFENKRKSWLLIGLLPLLVLLACSPPGSSLAGEPDALGRLLYDISVSKQLPVDAEINPVETAKDIFEGLKVASRDSIVLVHVKPGGNDAGDGSSLSTAKGTVQAALDAVSGESANNVHLILLASGTYRPAATLAMKNHVAIIGGFFASANDGVGYYRGSATEISGNDRIRVFSSTNLDTTNAQGVFTKSTAVLARLTVTGGKAAYGGGMYNSKSSPTVTEVTFSRNTATTDGGGMYNNGSSPTVTHATFSENTATGGGGGMFNTSSSPTVTHATFSENNAQYGGGMYNHGLSPTLTYATFSRNTATTDGGGMYNDGSSPTVTRATFSGNIATSNGGGMVNNGSSPTVTHVTFFGNTSTSGGGMVNLNTSSPTLTHVTFSRNTSTTGGGMSNFYTSSPTLTHVTFSGNTSTTGGGMYNRSSSPTVSRATFSRNTATRDGGGMSNSSSSPILTHVTFSRNTHQYKEEMYNIDSSPKIASSIFWESPIYNTNSAGNTAAPVVAHSMVQGGYTGGTAIITPTMSPFSGALGDNGGFVETIPIGRDSEARDKGLYFAHDGTNAYYSTDNSTWYTTPKASGTAAALPADAHRYTTDARGYSHNGRPDMGAYEHGGTAP